MMSDAQLCPSSTTRSRMVRPPTKVAGAAPLRLPRHSREVLGADLNRSESGRDATEPRACAAAPNESTPRWGRRLLHCGISIQPMTGLGHVWTAPAVQEESDYQRSVRVRSCIRPLSAAVWPLALM